MKRQTPIWLKSRSGSRDAGAKTKWKAPGARSPKRDGPSRMPAIISPTTAGCPMRTTRAPAMHAAAMIMKSWRKRRLRALVPFWYKLILAASKKEPAAGAEADGGRGAVASDTIGVAGGESCPPAWRTAKIPNRAMLVISKYNLTVLVIILKEGRFCARGFPIILSEISYACPELLRHRARSCL